jgi:hypothetical protein
MTDQDDTQSGAIPRPVHDLIAQLRGVTEKLVGLTGLAGLAESLPGGHALPSLLRPAALSVAQLKAVTSTVAAQRASIEAMQGQLRAFDDQLTVMEKILEPLTEWTTAWADLEQSVMGLPSGPAG